MNLRFFNFERIIIVLSVIAFPAAGTRFAPAFVAGTRAQTIPVSGLLEKLFDFLLSPDQSLSKYFVYKNSADAITSIKKRAKARSYKQSRRRKFYQKFIFKICESRVLYPL